MGPSSGRTSEAVETACADRARDGQLTGRHQRPAALEGFSTRAAAGASSSAMIEAGSMLALLPIQAPPPLSSENREASFSLSFDRAHRRPMRYRHMAGRPLRSQPDLFRLPDGGILGVTTAYMALILWRLRDVVRTIDSAPRRSRK
jgi:hypothetical protein